VPLAVYDETIGVLRRAVERAKLGDGDRLAAIKRLDDQARLVDARAMPPAEFDRAVAAEWAAKSALGGRTVADDRHGRKKIGRPIGVQLGLPFAQ
jgi:hypothetical protein